MNDADNEFTSTSGGAADTLPTPDDPFVSTAKIAKMFDVTTETVRNWITCEPPKMAGVQVNGRWKVRQSEVTRFANTKYGDTA